MSSRPEGRQPVPVLAVLGGESEERELEEQVALYDDAYWAVFIRKPFTWPRFMIWHVARRWVEPRDIRKR